MKRSARWLVMLFVVGGIVAGSLMPGLAAEQGELDNLRRLALENRVAETIADLRLTAEQKEQLKQVASSYRDAREAAMAELEGLLAKRRDALLADDRKALDEVNDALSALATRRPLASDENAAEFVSGLTERQRQVLARILPAIGERQAPRLHVRELPGLPEVRRQMPRLEPMPAPQMPRRAAPATTMLYVMHGWDLEIVDILIELLDR